MMEIARIGSGLLALVAFVPAIYGYEVITAVMWITGCGGMIATTLLYNGSGWDIP